MNTRARDLEDAGLAYRLETKMQSPALNKMEPAPQNKAADAGPLGSLVARLARQVLRHHCQRTNRSRNGAVARL
jgi:hypothetical protein